MYIGYENAWIILRYEENFTVVMIFIIRSISFGLYLTHSLLIRCPYLGIFFLNRMFGSNSAETFYGSSALSGKVCNTSQFVYS